MIEFRPNPDLTLPSQRFAAPQTRITLQSPLRQIQALSSPSTSFQGHKKAPISDAPSFDGRQIPMAQPIYTIGQIRAALVIQPPYKEYLPPPSNLFENRAQESPYSLPRTFTAIIQTNDGRQDDIDQRNEPEFVRLDTEVHTEENLNPETRANRENPERQEPEMTEDDISKAAHYRVLYHFIFNTYLVISYVLGYFLVANKISIQVPFITSIVLIVLYIFLLIKTNDFSTQKDKFGLFLSVGNSLSLIVFIIAAFIKAKTGYLLLTPFCIPAFLLLFGSCIKNPIDEANTSKLILITLKSVVWIQILLISLLIDGVQVEWSPTFVPSYFIFMMLGFFSLIVAVGSVVGFIAMVKEEGFSLPTLAGSLWYIINALYVAVWSSVLSQLVRRLNEGTGDLKTPLIVGIIHSGIMFVYAILLWRPLCKFQELEIESLLSPIEPDNLSKAPQVTFKVSKETKLKLKMISPTFFQYFKSYLKNKKKNKNVALQDTGLEAQRDTESQGQKKDNERICAVCFDRVSNAVLMNCGHGGVCYECALEHWKKTDNCMMCRMPIVRILKISEIIPNNDEIHVVESVRKIVKNGTL